MQRHQRDAPTFVEVRILLFEPGAERVHFSLGLIECHTWPQDTNGAQEPPGVHARIRTEHHWQPKLRAFRDEGILFDKEIKTFRHYANDRVRLAIEREGLADDVSLTAEVFLPETISQHRDVVFALYAIFFNEGSAEHCMSA